MFKPYCGPKGGANYVTCANQLFYAIQFQCTDVLAQNYPGKVFSPNLLGSFQTAGKVPGAGIGKPVDGVFSPVEFTGPTKLCLHANDKGYDVIFANLWELFFKHHVESDFVGTDSFWRQEYAEWSAVCKATQPLNETSLEAFKLNYLSNMANNSTLSVPLCDMADIVPQ